MYADGGGGGDGDVGGGGGVHGSGWGNHNENEYGDDDHGEGKNDNSGLMKCFGICGGICCIIISLGLIIGGAAVLGSSVHKSNNYAETMGTIIDLRNCGSSCSGSNSNRGNSNSCSETYGAIVEYTVDDTDYVIELSSCTNPAPTIGNDIKVLYDPDDPEEGVNGSWVGLYLAPTILLAIGIPIFCTITVMCCIASRSKFLGKDKPVEVNGAVTTIG